MRADPQLGEKESDLDPREETERTWVKPECL
jgi:hypothetical protein